MIRLVLLEDMGGDMNEEVIFQQQYFYFSRVKQHSASTHIKAMC